MSETFLHTALMFHPNQKLLLSKLYRISHLQIFLLGRRLIVDVQKSIVRVPFHQYHWMPMQEKLTLSWYNKIVTPTWE